MRIDKSKDMKKIYRILFCAGATAMSLMSLVSCDNASELPPMNDGYATEFILPDPVDLTMEERYLIEALQDEYNADIAQ